VRLQEKNEVAKMDAEQRRNVQFDGEAIQLAVFYCAERKTGKSIEESIKAVLKSKHLLPQIFANGQIYRVAKV
jgi:hypothetical protein